jgi:phage terminase Nu1 subunit (DNA packaging protein)
MTSVRALNGVTQSEVGRVLGITQSAVSQHVKAGKLSTLPDGSMDPETAAREYAERTNPVKPKGRKTGPKPAGEAEGTMYRSQERLAAAKAEQAELELAQLRGDMLRADEVKAAAFVAARTARDQLLSIPQRLAPVVASLTDPRDCQRAIEAEVRRVCLALSGGTGGSEPEQAEIGL